MDPILDVRFYASELGAEPVRDWLKQLAAADRRRIGEDIKTVQFGWPLGMPVVRNLGGGLWEGTDQTRKPHSAGPIRSGRLYFGVASWLYQEVTGHAAGRLGFGQGSAQTVAQEMTMGKKNIGSSFDDFLDEEAMLEESTAVAIKRVIAWQIAEEMQAQHLTKTALAKKMRTSRAALNRLLDENDASLTLTTLASAAVALGKKIDLRLAN